MRPEYEMCYIYEKTIIDKIYLAQSDTTVGFVSQNLKKLQHIKSRPSNKKFVICVDSLQTLKNLTRIPKIHKKLIRNSKKTTFIYQNKALRVVKDPSHLLFLKKLKWAYSTSANKTGSKYDNNFAYTNSDIIIVDPRGLQENISSKIFKLGRNKIQRLR